MGSHPAAGVIKFFLPLALSIWPFYAEGASPTEEAVAKLTGGSSREWVFKQMRSFMGNQSSCIEGEIYKFSVDKTLTIEQCVNGKINKSAHTWSIEESTPLNIIIKINGSPFVLLFRDTGD
jgi:hypothetical protein